MKKHNNYNLNLIILVTAILLVFSIKLKNLDADEYSPYPIIFVHGLGANYNKTWDYTSKGFYNDYFKDKYFSNYFDYYFPYSDYSPANMDISDYPVARVKAAIDYGLAHGFPSDYTGLRKVIIVAHSMGGLVVRSLLRQYSDYQNKIDRVIFLGVPHQGSPLASAYWLVNEETKVLGKKIKTNSMYAKNALGHFYIRKYLAYQDLLTDMRFDRIRNIGLINGIRGLINVKPNDVVLKQLRIPADVSSQVSFVGIGGIGLPAMVSDVVNVGHKANGDDKNGQIDTKIVTYDGNDMLSAPQNFSTLKGTGGTFWGSLLSILSNLEFSRSYSGLPPGNSLSDLIIGDGVVTQYSQTALQGSRNTFSKYVSHFSEPNEKETILQAIDDPPVIESAYFVRRYPTSYAVIKVKDYLLADIEIADMRVDGQAVDLNEFKDTVTGAYKPYVKFKKDFLTERPVTLLGLDLKPGEFYVPITIPYDFNPHAIYFKFKNPALKEAEAALYLPAIRYIIKEVYYISDPGSGPGYGQDFWVNLREATYNVFRNVPKEVKTHSVYSSLGVGREAWIYGGSYYSYQYHDYFWMWDVYINMTYGCMLNFDLNLADKNIKSAKFIYNFYKDLQGINENFDVLILRDSSNTWPPTINSSADTLLFELNTSSLPNADQPKIELQKTIDIPIEHINPSGYNVWQIRPNPNLPETNCIPEPIFDGDHAEANFSQTMRILCYPSLFVTFEEKH